MPKVSRDQLLEQLSDQRSFIRSSCDAFDNGNWAEAKRLALSARILLHETGTSHSLLGQLGVLETMEFFHLTGEVDDDHADMVGNKLAPVQLTEPGWSVQFQSDGSAPPNIPTEFTDLGTVHIALSGPVREPVAPLWAQRNFLSRHDRKRIRGGDWTSVGPWKDAKVVGTTNREYFSRWDMVGWVANKDGGAHVDPRLPLRYTEYRDQLSHGFVVVAPDGTHGRTGNPVPFAIRSIARELEISLEHLDLRE